MNKTLRNVLAGIAGFVVIMVVLSSLEGLLPKLLTLPPAPANTQDTAAWQAYVAAMPTEALLMLIANYAVAGFAGGYVAAALAAKPAPARLPWVIAILFTTAGAFNLYMLQHPLWVGAACLIVQFVSPHLGYRLRK